MIGSIIGAEDTIISVLFTIAFTKRTNKKALGTSVLPYISIEKEKSQVEVHMHLSFLRLKRKNTIFLVGNHLTLM